MRFRATADFDSFYQTAITGAELHYVVMNLFATETCSHRHTRERRACYLWEMFPGFDRCSRSASLHYCRQNWFAHRDISTVSLHLHLDFCQRELSLLLPQLRLFRCCSVGPAAAELSEPSRRVPKRTEVVTLHIGARASCFIS